MADKKPGIFLVVYRCQRHGFESLCTLTIGEDDWGSGTRLLGPKSCCDGHREVAAWRLNDATARDVARELLRLTGGWTGVFRDDERAPVSETRELVSNAYTLHEFVPDPGSSNGSCNVCGERHRSVSEPTAGSPEREDDTPLVAELDDDSDGEAGCCCMCFAPVGKPHKRACEKVQPR